MRTALTWDRVRVVAAAAPGLLGAVLSVGIVVPLAAGAVPTYVAGVGCNGPFQSNEGSVEVSDSCNLDPIGAAFFGGTSVLDANAQSAAGPGGLKVRSSTSIGGANVRSGSDDVSAQAWAEWTFDDFIVNGPAGSGDVPILAALNLQISGSLSPAPLFTDLEGPLTTSVSAFARFNFRIELDGVNAGAGRVARDNVDGSISEPVEGLLVGHYASGEEVSDAITSSQLMIPVGSAFTVYVYVNAAASSFASANIVGPADDGDNASFIGDATSDFSATVEFPTSGPVFVIPAGYTVNSASAGILDNEVVVPEPASILLVATALAASGVRRLGARARKGSLS